MAFGGRVALAEADLGACKSLLAAAVLQRVAKMLHVPGFLEVAVENDSFLDLADFDIRLHAGVFLDGVGDAEVLKQNREVLQGRPKLCKADRSPTIRLSTAYSLYRRAVVVTFDLAAKNLRLLQSDPRLSNNKNIIRLHLSAPARETADLAPAAPPPGPRSVMEKWSVDEVVLFALARDLAGVACERRQRR